ncbi:hypothetical protein SLS60_011213 [Paraconiothyrium brasiliense]|uniref:Nudix hydrolase domain-containing protein n=1 Tax=Paraconiothyrium brasiliense TaxID=300254 RepID=A0ABR3QLT1_9PLEO
MSWILESIRIRPRNLVDQMTWPEFWVLDRETRTLTLEHGTDFAMRTDLFRDTLEAAIESAKVDVLPKWTKEMFPLYSADGQHILDMDGIGLDAFGVVNFAVHMIGFVRADSTTKYWVPSRAKTKLSYPDMLDNTVEGSLATGEKPIDCMVRECEEELCLDPSYTQSNLKACGTISYSMDQTDSGHVGCQHQVQYLYELEFTQDIIPKIGDGEVGEVSLMTLDEVRAALAGGEFKLNCAMTWLAFLIRNGHITAENESDLVEICSRLHRKHDLFIV